jgi:uncharacterized RDD family membrane protein YckC
MSDNSEIPYVPIVELRDSDAEIAMDSTRDELAGRLLRLGAAMLDGLLLMAILLPVQFATGFIHRAQLQQNGLMEQFAMSLLGMVVFLLLNGYLLFTRGQTIGKLVAGIQVVDFKTGLLLPFLRIYVYRHLWTLPLVVMVLIIPGNVDDMLISVVVMIDVLLIFGENQRCLHDLFADSKVVVYMADRPKLAA